MTVSSEIIEVLDYLGEKFGIAIDWTSNNVLPYLQTLADKFIKWEITEENFCCNIFIFHCSPKS